MKRISIRVNVLALDKSRFVDSTYQNKAGETVTKKDVLLDVILQDKDKHTVITGGDTWELLNIGFVTEQATKEEKAAKIKKPIVGGATMFTDKVAQPNFSKDSKGNDIGDAELDAIKPEDVPF